MSSQKRLVHARSDYSWFQRSVCVCVYVNVFASALRMCAVSQSMCEKKKLYKYTGPV